jgi:N-methylhydantoinase B
MPGKLMAGGAEPLWITIWRGGAPASTDPFLFTLFQLGGAGARATKDGLSATGFPSGVGGVPVEVIETLAPLVVHHRELREDSGGAGKFRGGLGQRTEMSRLGDAPWSVSAMIDRVKFAGAGLEGGNPGALGEFIVDEDARPQPKSLVPLRPDSRVQLNLPGGGGYGNPFERDPAKVLDDVAKSFVSLDSAARDYGVVVRYLGTPGQLVRLPEHFAIDESATKKLREGNKK